MRSKNSGRGGAHRKSRDIPFPVFLRLLKITGSEEGEIKERVRERKSHFSDLFMMQWRYAERIRTCSSGHTVREDEVSSQSTEWASEGKKEEREKMWGRARRVAIPQKGVNHLISTAPPHSPQNGYSVPSGDQQHRRRGGDLKRRYLISHLFFHLNHFSYLCAGFIQHSAEWLLTCTFFLFFFFFYWERGLFNFAHFFSEGQFNVLVNYNIAFNFRPKFVNWIYLWWSCTFCIKKKQYQARDKEPKAPLLQSIRPQRERKLDFKKMAWKNTKICIFS